MDNKEAKKRESKALSRESVLGAKDLDELRRIEIPEWGGHAFLRVMTGRERDHLENIVEQGKRTKKGTKNFRAMFASLVLVNEEGGRLFNSTEADIKLLGDKSAAALDRILEIGYEINGFSADDVAALEGN